MKGERAMALGALLVAAGIGIGALGAHALREVLDERQLQSLHTAVYYQIFNALGLLLVGSWARGGHKGLSCVLWVLAGGVVLFSGSIYLLLAGAPRLFGFVTPVGGVMLIVAWLMLAWRLVRKS